MTIVVENTWTKQGAKANSVAITVSPSANNTVVFYVGKDGSDSISTPSGLTLIQNVPGDGSAVNSSCYKAEYIPDTRINGLEAYTNPSNSDGVQFNPAGDKYYTIYLDRIYEYSVSVPFDLSSTVTQQSFFDPSQSGVDFDNFTFSADGSIVYFCDNLEKKIYSYDLNTAWDVSSIVDASFQQTGAVFRDYINGISFSDDGLRLITVTNIYHEVAEYTLSTAWDITSTITEVSYVSLGLDVLDVMYLDSGSTVWLLSDTGNIREYPLSTAYDFTTRGSLTTISLGTVTKSIGFYALDDKTAWYLDDQGSGVSIVYKSELGIESSYQYTFTSAGSEEWAVAAFEISGVVYADIYTRGITPCVGTGIYPTCGGSLLTPNPVGEAGLMLHVIDGDSTPFTYYRSPPQVELASVQSSTGAGSVGIACAIEISTDTTKFATTVQIASSDQWGAIFLDLPPVVNLDVEGSATLAGNASLTAAGTVTAIPNSATLASNTALAAAAVLEFAGKADLASALSLTAIPYFASLHTAAWQIEQNVNSGDTGAVYYDGSYTPTVDMAASPDFHWRFRFLVKNNSGATITGWKPYLEYRISNSAWSHIQVKSGDTGGTSALSCFPDLGDMSFDIADVNYVAYEELNASQGDYFWAGRFNVGVAGSKKDVFAFPYDHLNTGSGKLYTFAYNQTNHRFEQISSSFTWNNYDDFKTEHDRLRRSFRPFTRNDVLNNKAIVEIGLQDPKPFQAETSDGITFSTNLSSVEDSTMEVGINGQEYRFVTELDIVDWYNIYVEHYNGSTWTNKRLIKRVYKGDFIESAAVYDETILVWVTQLDGSTTRWYMYEITTTTLVAKQNTNSHLYSWITLTKHFNYRGESTWFVFRYESASGVSSYYKFQSGIVSAITLDDFPMLEDGFIDGPNGSILMNYYNVPYMPNGDIDRNAGWVAPSKLVKVSDDDIWGVIAVRTFGMEVPRNNSQNSDWTNFNVWNTRTGGAFAVDSVSLDIHVCGLFNGGNSSNPDRIQIFDDVTGIKWQDGSDTTQRLGSGTFVSNNRGMMMFGATNHNDTSDVIADIPNGSEVEICVDVRFDASLFALQAGLLELRLTDFQGFHEDSSAAKILTLFSKTIHAQASFSGVSDFTAVGSSAHIGVPIKNHVHFSGKSSCKATQYLPEMQLMGSMMQSYSGSEPGTDLHNITNKPLVITDPDFLDYIDDPSMGDIAMFRVRWLINNNSGASINFQPKIQCRADGGAWEDLSKDSTPTSLIMSGYEGNQPAVYPQTLDYLLGAGETSAFNNLITYLDGDAVHHFAVLSYSSGAYHIHHWEVSLSTGSITNNGIYNVTALKSRIITNIVMDDTGGFLIATRGALHPDYASAVYLLKSSTLTNVSPTPVALMQVYGSLAVGKDGSDNAFLITGRGSTGNLKNLTFYAWDSTLESFGTGKVSTIPGTIKSCFYDDIASLVRLFINTESNTQLREVIYNISTDNWTEGSDITSVLHTIAGLHSVIEDPNVTGRFHIFMNDGINEGTWARYVVMDTNVPSYSFNSTQQWTNSGSIDSVYFNYWTNQIILSIYQKDSVYTPLDKDSVFYDNFDFRFTQFYVSYYFSHNIVRDFNVPGNKSRYRQVNYSSSNVSMFHGDFDDEYLNQNDTTQQLSANSFVSNNKAFLSHHDFFTDPIVIPDGYDVEIVTALALPEQVITGLTHHPIYEVRLYDDVNGLDHRTLYPVVGYNTPLSFSGVANFNGVASMTAKPFVFGPGDVFAKANFNAVAGFTATGTAGATNWTGTGSSALVFTYVNTGLSHGYGQYNIPMQITFGLTNSVKPDYTVGARALFISPSDFTAHSGEPEFKGCL